MGARRRMTYNMHQAKTNLSRLVDAACLGEDVVIAKDGEPAVRLVPVVVRRRQRPAGLFAGKIRIGDDFDAPLPEELTGMSPEPATGARERERTRRGTRRAGTPRGRARRG